MNKTITIALAGFSIIIEEEAYFTLAQYLKALRASLEADEADEVMHDIELRIYEILKDQLSTEKCEVVNEVDIEKVIFLMGTPEQISNSADEATNTSNFKRGKRQLYRNPDDKIVSGVAAGIAEYLGIKAVWIRLIFILFSFTLITIVIYITLWIIMPVAQSTTDILKMKGQSLNFENIKEQSVKFARRADSEIGEAINGLSPMARNAVTVIVKFIRMVFKVICYTFGVSFLIMVVSIVGSAILGITVASLQETSLLSNLYFFVENKIIVWIGIITAVLITILLFCVFLFLSIKFFNPKKKIPHMGWILGTLGIVCLLGCMVCASFPIQIASKNDGFWIEKKQQINLNTILDTLQIQQVDTTYTGNFKNYWGDIQSDGQNIIVKSRKYIEIDTTSEANPRLEISTEQIQNKNTGDKLMIAVKVQNNKILIPNKNLIHVDNKFNKPFIHIKLLVPKNKLVSVDQNLSVNKNKLNLIDSVFRINKK